MANTDGGTVGLVAACMARGLTPEQTQAVFEELYGVHPADSAEAIQRQIEEVIERVAPPVTMSETVDWLFKNPRERGDQ
jgi:hypothetical protein